MSRGTVRGGFTSRFDAVLGRHDDLDDEDLVEDEPLEVHYQRQADRIRRRLAAATQLDDRSELGRLQRELVEWERLATSATVEAHWASGEGDRKLF